MDARIAAWSRTGRFVEIDGRRIFTWSTGQGPTLLAIHGFPVSSYDWRLAAERLPHRRFVALDLPGYGLSDKSPDADYSLDAQADVVEEVAAMLGIGNCDVIAHDMGDSVVAELVARANEGRGRLGINRTVLLNGSIFIDLARLTPGQKLFLRLPARALPFSPPVRAFRRQIRKLFSPQHAPPDQELEMMESLLTHDGGARLVPVVIRYIEERRQRQHRWTSAFVDWPNELTLIWGLLDPVAVPAMADRMESLRPQTEIVRWDDVGHWPQLEVPERLAAELERVLA